MIRFCVLGSGSKGNSTFIEIGKSRFLIDAGFNKTETRKRLASIGRSVDDIQKIFITHNHTDHIKPWVQQLIQWHSGFVSDEFTITSFPLSHDEPCVGYTIQDNDGNKIAIATDTGCVSEEALYHLLDCKALLIECNYDVNTMVWGRYSAELQARVGSSLGHLKNECAAEVVEAVSWPGLKHIVALHLSEVNNNPGFVKFCLGSVNEHNAEIMIASQSEPTPIITII